MVPFAGMGLLSARTLFPVTIGANVGTTATAIIASLSGNSAGLAIALVHFIFNVLGMLIWFPLESLRKIPLDLAEKLGLLVSKHRYVAFVYIGILFLGFPLVFVIF